MRWLLLIFFLSINCFGQEATNETNEKEQLSSVNQFTFVQMKNNETLQQELEEFNNQKNKPTNGPVTQDHIREKQLQLEQIKIDLDNFNGRVNYINKTITDEMRKLDGLQTLLQKQINPLARGTDLDAQQSAIEQTKLSLSNTEDYIKALSQQKQVIMTAINLMNQKKTVMEALYQKENEQYLANHQQLSNQNEDKFILDKIKELEKAREVLMQKKIAVRDNRDDYLDKNIELMIIGKQLLFENNMLELMAMDRHLQELLFADLTNVSLERIKKIQEELKSIGHHVEALKKSILENFQVESEQFALYARQRQNIPDEIRKRQEEFNRNYQKMFKLIENVNLNLEMINKNTDKQYNLIAENNLKQRYTLSKDVGISEISRAIREALTAFAGQYAVAIETVCVHLRDNSHNYPLIIFVGFILTTIATVFLIRRINRLSSRYRHESNRLPFAKRLMLFIYDLLKHTLPYIALLILTIIMVNLAELPAPSSYLVILIPSLFLAITIPNFATKLLLSSQLVQMPENSNIVNTVTIFSAIGSVLFALIMLSQWVLISSSELVTNSLRWFFGIYCLLASYPFFRTVFRTISFTNEYYGEFYIYKILRVLFILVPVATALFGLLSAFGYLNMAWIFAWHFAIFTGFAIVWAGLLAIYKDISLAAKRYALKNTSNGLFWTQDVINPIHSIFRYGSLVLFIYLLLQIFEWNSNTPVIRELFDLFKTPIFGNKKSQFTLLNMVLMAFLIYVVFRIGGWVRSFCYRWIFAKIMDLGIRNSFAVFSQYAVVTIGFLMALRIIGIDLTAFTVFAGALGVGIGFGMQTIANNFVSGILLLIERPLRNGDIITVNEYEGKVERIGMRSVTISTFNNESVILPNSEFVTKPFMNWSYADTVLRTVLYLDLSLRHDPEMVKKAFAVELDKLVAREVILNNEDFEYGIFAYNYSDRGVTYRIQYYLNMDFAKINDSRHAVIDALWKACKNYNLELAYPKQENIYSNFGQFEEVVQRKDGGNSKLLEKKGG